MHMGSVNVIGLCTVCSVQVSMFMCPCNVCFHLVWTPARLATVAVEASGDMKQEMELRDGCKWSAWLGHVTASGVPAVLTLRGAQEEPPGHFVQIQHQSDAISCHTLQRPSILLIASF